MVHADNDIAGWLVEWPQSKNNHARWWHPEHGWCIDANDAIRFMRKEDAEAYIKSMRFGDGRVATEHVWFNERLWPKPMGHAYRDIDLAAAAKQDSQRGELWTAAHAALTFIQNEYRDDEAAALQGDPFSHEARPVIAELCSALWPEPPVPTKQAPEAPPVTDRAETPHDQNTPSTPPDTPEETNDNPLFEIGSRVRVRDGDLQGELLEFNADVTGALVRWDTGNETWKNLRNLEVVPPDTPEADKLLARVKVKRDREGLSIRAAAAELGLSFSTLARLERGTGEPSAKIKARLSEWISNPPEAIGDEVVEALREAADAILQYEEIGSFKTVKARLHKAQQRARSALSALHQAGKLPIGGEG